MSGGAPSEPSYGTQMQQTLLAQEQAATGTGEFSGLGPLINLESNPTTGVPAWSNLSLDQLNTILNGSPATGPTAGTPATSTPAGWYNANGQMVSSNPQNEAPNFSAGQNGLTKALGFVPPKDQNLTWEPGSSTPGTPATAGGPATPGLLSLSQQANPILAGETAQANTISRTANVQDLQNLGPQYIAAQNAANPGAADLLATMTNQANQQLQMGSNLTPQQTRTATQAVRAQNQGMLGGTGNAGDFAQALGLSSYGQNLYNNRLQYAQNALGANQSYYGNPYQALIGGTSTGTSPSSYIGQASGISQGVTNPYNPSSQQAANIQNANSQIAAQNSAASASTTNSLIGAGASAAGLLALAFL